MLSKLWALRDILRKPPDARSMAEKLAVSGALTSFEYAITIFCRIGSTLIVTRLLSPEIFGLASVIVTFQIIVIMVTDFGIRSLIIVSEESRDPRFLQTCWSVQIARGLALWGIVALLALLLWGLQTAGLVTGDTVYADAVLPPALALAGGQLLLQGMEAVNQHVYAKDMRFGRITLLNILRAITLPMLTIAISYYHPSIWAIVIAGLLGGLSSVILTFALFPGTPMRLCWEKKYARELFNRGKWIMSHSALRVVTTAADKIILSAFLSPSLLGVYFLASQIIEVPNNFLYKLKEAMGLQFFQKYFIDSAETPLTTSYYRFRIPFDIAACIMSGGLITASPAIIEIMYDPRYSEAGYIMQIIAVGIPLFVFSIIRDAYSVQKRFRIMTLISLIQACSIWIGLLIALPVLGSMIGAFLVIALHRLPEIVTLLFLARREGWIDLVKEVRFLPVIGIGALIGWGVDRLWAAVAP